MPEGGRYNGIAVFHALSGDPGRDWAGGHEYCGDIGIGDGDGRKKMGKPLFYMRSSY